MKMESKSAKNQPDHSGSAGTQMASDTGHAPYGRFALMLGLSFVAMFVLMYAMVDRIDNAVPNINQVYMAGLMTAPMLILEILLMQRIIPTNARIGYCW